MLAALVADVVWLMPVPKALSPEKRIAFHQEGDNYTAAERMISPLLPSPAVEWSQPLICGDAGHGVWLMQGEVKVEFSPDGVNPIPWRVIFIPATLQPLYLRLGSREVGDLRAALLQTGVQMKKP